MRCAEPRPGAWHRRAQRRRDCAKRVRARPGGRTVTCDVDEDNGGGRHGEAGARLVRVRIGHGGGRSRARAVVGGTGAERPAGAGRRRAARAAGATECGSRGPLRPGPHPSRRAEGPPRCPGRRRRRRRGVLARLRPRERAGRARGVAGRAGSRPRGGGGDRVPAPRVRAGRPAGGRTAGAVGPPPGQRRDGQRRLRAGLVGAPLRGLRRLPRDRGRAPHGAAAAGPRPGRHARGCQAADRQHRAGCGRADRGRGATNDAGAQRLPGPGPVLRRRDVRSQCRPDDLPQPPRARAGGAGPPRRCGGDDRAAGGRGGSPPGPAARQRSAPQAGAAPLRSARHGQDAHGALPAGPHPGA